MKLYLDTSTATTILKLDEKTYEWVAGKELAEGIFQFIHEKLTENNADWQDLSEIHFMSGPGSFTGLRIGATVVNALADQLNIPLYNHKGEKVEMIIPEYGRPARITAPRK